MPRSSLFCSFTLLREKRVWERPSVSSRFRPSQPPIPLSALQLDSFVMAKRTTGGPGAARRVSARLSRREVLRGFTAASVLAAVAPGQAAARAVARSPTGPRVIVVGAGAFRAFTAPSLLRRGAHVTLIDAWG